MVNYKQILKVLIWILFANLLVAFTKLGFGYFLNINSLIADGFHSLVDSFSNVIGVVGIKLAAKPASKDYPYGREKFETIAGFCVGILLVGIIIKIIISAIDALINPKYLELSLISLISLALTILINIFVAVLEYRAGKRLKSDILIYDSIHTKSDVFISFGVLISLIFIKLGAPVYIDPILSLIIVIFILKSAFEILKMTIGILVDKKAVEEEEVVRILMATDKDVINVHKIRSRGRLDNVYIDLHIITKPSLSVKEAHDLAHRLEDALKEKLDKNVDLCCHIEPNERLDK